MQKKQINKLTIKKVINSTNDNNSSSNYLSRDHNRVVLNTNNIVNNIKDNNSTIGYDFGDKNDPNYINYYVLTRNNIEKNYYDGQVYVVKHFEDNKFKNIKTVLSESSGIFSGLFPYCWKVGIPKNKKMEVLNNKILTSLIIFITFITVVLSFIFHSFQNPITIIFTIIPLIIAVLFGFLKIYETNRSVCINKKYAVKGKEYELLQEYEVVIKSNKVKVPTIIFNKLKQNDNFTNYSKNYIYQKYPEVLFEVRDLILKAAKLNDELEETKIYLSEDEINVVEKEIANIGDQINHILDKTMMNHINKEKEKIFKKNSNINNILLKHELEPDNNKVNVNEIDSANSNFIKIFENYPVIEKGEKEEENKNG